MVLKLDDFLGRHMCIVPYVKICIHENKPKKSNLAKIISIKINLLKVVHVSLANQGHFCFAVLSKVVLFLLHPF